MQPGCHVDTYWLSLTKKKMQHMKYDYEDNPRVYWSSVVNDAS